MRFRPASSLHQAAQKQLAAETAKQQLQAQVLELQVGMLRDNFYILYFYDLLRLLFFSFKELAKVGREALEFKQKAENATVDLQAGVSVNCQLWAVADCWGPPCFIQAAQLVQSQLQGELQPQHMQGVECA